MIAPFEASKLKIDRAKRHLRELEDAIAAYITTDPCTLVVEPYPRVPRQHAWIARIRSPVPHELSPVIGDVVHNLRSSLDLLACDLVALTGRSTKNVYFPFCNTGAELFEAIKKRGIHKAGQDVVRVIQSLKPYKGGNVALRAIHDMDIADKHQALLPVIGGLTVPVGPILRAGKEFPLSQFSTTIVMDGQIIVGLPPTANLPLGTELPIRYLLVFGGDGPGFKGRQIIQFLHELTETADRIVDTLAALRPGAAFPVPTPKTDPNVRGLILRK